MTARLEEMTTAQARASVERGAIVLLPVGALEQHGPALPLGTDTVRAEAVVSRVAAELGDAVVVGPTVPVGVSPHHLAFTGTISLRPATFVTVLREYLESIAGHGWRRVLVVTGHGGNNAALGVLAQEVLRELPELELAWTPVTAVASDHVAAMDTSEVHGHCGEAETAQMLHVAPDLVRTDLLEPGTTRLDELDALSHLARTHKSPALALPYDRLSANGVLGDPRRATADDGRVIIDLVTERLVDFLTEWAAT